MGQLHLEGLRDLRLRMVQRLLHPSVYEQAAATYAQRRVHQRLHCGDTLEAQIEDDYTNAVRIEIKDGKLLTACTCPFAQTALCSHIGALLLHWIWEPNSFSTMPAQPLSGHASCAPQAPGARSESTLNANGGMGQTLSPLQNRPDSSEHGSALTGLLQQLPLDTLRQIARQRGWSIETGDQRAYASALAGLLSDATAVARAVISLPQPLQEALRAAFVIEDGHGVTPEGLARVVTALSLGSSRVKPVEAAGLLVDLAGLGLLLPWNSFPGDTTYLFPWEIQASVPPLPGWCPRPSPAPTTARAGAHDASEFVDLLTRLWHQVTSEPPLLSRPANPEGDTETRDSVWDRPSKARNSPGRQKRPARAGGQSRRRVTLPAPRPLLDNADAEKLARRNGVSVEKLDFALHLMLELNLAQARDTRLGTRGDAKARFARLAPSQQRRALAQAYLSMLSWSEVDALLRGQPRWVLTRSPYALIPHERLRSGLARARRMVLRFLAVAGARHPCPLSMLETALLGMWPEFFERRGSRDYHLTSAPLELSLRQSGDQPSKKRERPQTAFLRAVLFGPLQWLGYAKVYGQEGDPLLIELDGLADLLWGSPVEAAPSSTADAVQYDPSSGAITLLSDAVDARIPAFLGQIAHLESAERGRLVFRLDRRAAHRAFERGKLLSEIELEWQDVMPLSMPERFVSTLREWWSRYGAVRLYDGFALLEVEDEMTLRELEASTSLSQHIAARVSPRHVLIPEAQVDELLRQVQANGHMPRQVG